MKQKTTFFLFWWPTQVTLLFICKIFYCRFDHRNLMVCLLSGRYYLGFQLLLAIAIATTTGPNPSSGCVNICIYMYSTSLRVSMQNRLRNERKSGSKSESSLLSSLKFFLLLFLYGIYFYYLCFSRLLVFLEVSEILIQVFFMMS